MINDSNLILFISPAMYPCTFIIYIYIHITWSGRDWTWKYWPGFTEKKTRILHDSTITVGTTRTIQDHGDLTVGILRVFSLTVVGVKSWNGRTNAKELNFTIWKDPESKWSKSNHEWKIQSDLITQNKCLIGKQTTNLPGFAVNEPFIHFTTGAISMEFTSTSPTWHHGSWGRSKNLGL